MAIISCEEVSMSKTKQSKIERREFLKYGAPAAIGAWRLGFGFASEAKMNGQLPVGDPPMIHNMMIVGRQTVFLSHLPMFNSPRAVSPHRYQVILEATFTKPGSDTQAVYANDRKNNPKTKIYTLSPDKEFVLPNLVSSGAGSSLSRFTANIFRGHFEKREKKLLASDVDVNVKKVVHFREFDPNGRPVDQLEYILFGKGKELFLAHLITRPPDFDQILSVNITGHSFSDEELGKGLRVTFSRPNSIPQRLRENQEAVGEAHDVGGISGPVKLRVKPGVEFYFEEGELRVPADFGPTAAEREAGFP
jgi:hypothetical protein